MKINLQVHETLSGVISGQAQMLLDDIRWIHVALGQYLFVHKVSHHAIQGVTKCLLRILCQALEVDSPFLFLRLQDDGQSVRLQAELGSSVKDF